MSDPVGSGMPVQIGHNLAIEERDSRSTLLEFQHTFDIVGNNGFIRNLETVTINGEPFGGSTEGGTIFTNMIIADGPAGLEIHSNATPNSLADISFWSNGVKRWTIDGQYGDILPTTNLTGRLGNPNFKLSQIYGGELNGSKLLLQQESGGFGLSLQTNVGSGGMITFQKLTADPPNYGSGGAILYFRDGTDPNTMKLVVKAGQAGAETTVLDNIPI